MTRRSPAPRAPAARVPVAVAEIVGLTVLAHASAGGALPGSGYVVAVLGVVSLVAWALRHRLVSVRAAAVLAVGAQVALHAAFTHAVEHAGHTHDLATSGTGLDTGMLLAHAGGAVVTALALAWQEHVVVGLVGRLVPPLPVSVIVRVVRRPRPARSQQRPVSLRTVSTAPRRGPPVMASA